MKVLPGNPFPLAATFDGEGTNFSVFAQRATRVELCLFDAEGHELRVDLPELTAFCWHGYLPGVKPGQRYGFRVHGPWAPSEGLYYNWTKLLMDPYARAVDGGVEWNRAVFPYQFDDPTMPNFEDSAPFVPKSIVVHSEFDWGDDAPPRIPLHETIIYETHVKGFTAKHPEIPPEWRGTFAGLAHPVCLSYFKSLGVTAIELMPIHQFVQDHYLSERGLRNYWGYNTIGFFAPHNEYGSSPDGESLVNEFKAMVKAFHAAGLEVILDVVYNHTAEGNHLGPMLCFKGFDNPAYYRLVADNPAFYFDYTGTGNSLNMQHPHVLQLLMDSLRYWVAEMHVDGFRFDLAATLARGLHEVDRLSAFFNLIQQDPIINQVKLIAEPWDLGSDGYQVGNFPPLWSEWNGKYRDSVRDYWRGEEQTLGEFANRFTGSSDLYESSARAPVASINFVTAHDGFTLHDLVSYHSKHNQANGEDNNDGESHNRSWNGGVEGPSDDPAVIRRRAIQQRNFLATLMLSQGVPMLLGGDEFGRTQGGNNNAYCQDNEISWYNWENVDEALLSFTRYVIAFRQKHPVFHRRNWFRSKLIHGAGATDIDWFTPEGTPMQDEHWEEGNPRALAVYMDGRGILSRNEAGEELTDDSFYMMFNAYEDDLRFILPSDEFIGAGWRTVLDTSNIAALPDPKGYAAGEEINVPARSLLTLCRPQ